MCPHVGESGTPTHPFPPARATYLADMGSSIVIAFLLLAADEQTNKDTRQCLPPPSEAERNERLKDGPRNILGDPLEVCGLDPVTGYFRSGRCETGPTDRGVHVVCAQVDRRFLDYTKGKGNDLSTPRGSFPGLRPGDRWCLCAARWDEARRDGVAPPVVLKATDVAALRTLKLEELTKSRATKPAAKSK